MREADQINGKVEHQDDEYEKEEQAVTALAFWRHYAKSNLAAPDHRERHFEMLNRSGVHINRQC